MEAKFQIFLTLLGVLAGTALVARRTDIAPAILLLLVGVVLAFVPGMPSLELPPELVLLVVLPPLIPAVLNLIPLSPFDGGRITAVLSPRIWFAGVPVLVDAGVGQASDAAVAMELGCDGVLMNTAIAGARNPVLMASAMRKAVEAGREAFLAGRIPRKRFASASSPVDGLVG